ncbi:MAG: AIR synthase family protein, partial [Thermomicrobium sp.]|nr:AIR synthase family protein [Thermomicrobium sp.]
VFVVPAYGWERAAWFAVHILASDAATSGLAPRFMAIDLNLPLSMTAEELEALWTTIHRVCRELGIAIVAGHTARYEGCNYPMVGGATVMAIGPADRYVTPKMARVGDLVVVTKGAAIEAAGLFAVTFPERIAQAYGRAFAERAQELFWQMSVVEDALTAVSIGVRDDGVTAMHDATECGVLGGLVEVAEASGVGLRVERERIILRDEVAKICELFGMDPYAAISEGTLIVTVRPHKVDALLAALAAKGIAASVVGEVLPPERGRTIVVDGEERPLEHPRVDPFWAAFGRAMGETGDSDRDDH